MQHPTTISVKEGEFTKVPIADIDPSPFNYRKAFPVKKMKELAESIKIHGILENLNLRKMPSGRYEVVSGERRFRAAKMAGLTEIPAILKDLSDDEVKETQLTENLQREDPHPLEEAEAIGELQTRYKTIGDIAGRLGKSKTFIYGRLKLLTLVPDLREMFTAEVFTLKQVLQIAGLSPQSQQDFYHDYCEDWKNEDFETPEIPYTLSRFTNELGRAPFDIKDKGLLPDRGACTSCPYNSATLKTLFPEEAAEATCKDSGCFQRKSAAHFTRILEKAVKKHRPSALLFYGCPSAAAQTAIKEIPAAASLPQYSYHSACVVSEPERPDPKDYVEEEREEEEEAGEYGYAQALEEYQAEWEEYQHQLRAGNLIKALHILDQEVKPCLFGERSASPAKALTQNPTVTAAQVKEALRTGNATPELLRAEIERIVNRETRSKELDKEKLQLSIHRHFSEQIANPANDQPPTMADHAAARFILFESLDYPTRELVLSRLCPEQKEGEADPVEKLYDLLTRLSDEQYVYLVRVALSTRSEAKCPTSQTGYFLSRMASDAGLNIASLIKEQETAIQSRQRSQTERIKALEKRIAEFEAA